MAVKPMEEKPWLAEGSEKRMAVRDMFADIAPRYDLLNSLISFRLHHRWRRFAVAKLSLRLGDSVLDLCCGTGDFMVPLGKAAGEKVFGIDFCLPMLEISKRKGHHKVAEGDACRIPVQSGVLDGVSVGWGIRNVPDIDAAHREVVRVLKPGGRFVSLDMARPRSAFMRSASSLVCERFVPFLGTLFGKKKAYTYLPQSTKRFMSREELAASMKGAGMRDVGWKDMFFGNICVHWGTKP